MDAVSEYLVWFRLVFSLTVRFRRSVCIVRDQSEAWSVSVVRSSEVPLLGGSKCTSSMGKSIGGVRFVRCTEVVRFSESPLLEVLLYIFERMILCEDCILNTS